MPEEYPNIGIIGGGNMGEAFAGAVIRAGIFQPFSVTISEILPERLEYLKATYRVNVNSDNFKVFDSCKIVILAVKPQHMEKTLAAIAQHPEYSIRESKLVISIAAGITIEKIEHLLYTSLEGQFRKKLPIIRVMPNTPALVLEGMSGMSANRYASRKEKEVTRKILQTMGNVIELEEKHMNAVTALSGSGPAYVFYLIEAMIEAGIKMGLNPEDSEQLTLTTIKGSAALMEAKNETAEKLRKQVTSPGGTTEAAVKVLEKDRVKQSIVSAILAGANRARELSEF